MVRPAQKLTSVHPSCVDVGDTVSVDFEHVDGVFTTRVGTLHRVIYEGDKRTMFTQQGGEIMTWRHGEKTPRVFIVERAPKVESVLELFNELA